MSLVNSRKSLGWWHSQKSNWLVDCFARRAALIHSHEIHPQAVANADSFQFAGLKNLSIREVWKP
jgi:hypothetical protein